MTDTTGATVERAEGLFEDEPVTAIAITEDDARAHAEVIRNLIGSVADNVTAWGEAIATAYTERHHEILKYGTGSEGWAKYCEGEFQTAIVRLSAVYADSMVIRLREDAQMSTRSIAAALGMSQPTVRRRIDSYIRSIESGESSDSPLPATVTSASGKDQAATKTRKPRLPGSGKSTTEKRAECQHESRAEVRCRKCGSNRTKDASATEWVEAIIRKMGAAEAKTVGQSLIAEADKALANRDALIRERDKMLTEADKALAKRESEAA
jgi:AsnC-type helix-turn-helix domain